MIRMAGDLVLDTSVVIAALRGVPGVEAKHDTTPRLPRERLRLSFTP
jgi:hypothetical protein